MIVDDEKSIRLGVKALRWDAGCAANVAEDAQTARVLLPGGYYDVVVSDVVMPGASGKTSPQAIRETLPSQPVTQVFGCSGNQEGRGEQKSNAPSAKKNPGGQVLRGSDSALTKACKCTGLRVTRARIRLYRSLVQRHDHPDMDRLFTDIRLLVPSILPAWPCV